MKKALWIIIAIVVLLLLAYLVAGLGDEDAIDDVDTEETADDVVFERVTVPAEVPADEAAFRGVFEELPEGAVLALVDTIEVERARGSVQPRYRVIASGNHVRDCQFISGTEQRAAGSVLYVQIEVSERETVPVCNEELTAFEEQILLDTEGLAPGTYTVNVNGIQASFVLEED